MHTTALFTVTILVISMIHLKDSQPELQEEEIVGAKYLRSFLLPRATTELTHERNEDKRFSNPCIALTQATINGH
jgi:hypothetical protein